MISIPTLRAEGDCSRSYFARSHLHFNPHPPCGGRPGANDLCTDRDNFNPHPPCGGRCNCDLHGGGVDIISIPTLLAEGDNSWAASASRKANFNPHPPCGGRCTPQRAFPCTACISIPTLLAEGDARVARCPHGTSNFNPHPPCGGRLARVAALP